MSGSRKWDRSWRNARRLTWKSRSGSALASSGQAPRPPSQHADPRRENRLIAVIFEVWPAEGRAGDYFDIAAALRSELERSDGFISIERFESITTPGKFLSLSFWRDEECVRRWRNV